MNVDIEKSWKIILHNEFEKDYFKKIVHFLDNEKANNKIAYPTEENIFNAFNKCSFEKIKVVLLGQDPYHGPEQAHGLSFSVLPPALPPPSLKNIFKELLDDVQVPIPKHGNLEKWATQGILLLNTSLTVRANEPMSHSKIGWETFTDTIIQKISDQKENIVFMLWGKFAQQKKILIDEKKHLILEAAHPSPLSAYNGFWGCKHFSKTNFYLKEKNKLSIDWQI
jgi:uracil-DNA glycosylase